MEWTETYDDEGYTVEMNFIDKGVVTKERYTRVVQITGDYYYHSDENGDKFMLEAGNELMNEN